MISLFITGSGLLAVSSLQILYAKTRLVTTLPTTVAGLMIILHMLAFANALPLIDWVMLGCVIVAIPVILLSKDLNKMSTLRMGYLNPSSLAFLIVLVVVVFGMSGVGIIAYDDFKFWASTVKSLYFQNGYGAPYTNIGVNYGEYPQGALLLLWLGEHCSNAFREDILYISYTLFSLCFVLPIFKNVEKYRYAPLVAIVVIAFSSAFMRFGASLEPDRMMALAYGCAIVSAYNAAQSGKNYFLVQFALVCCAISLIKSDGIGWSFLALVFLFLLLRKQQRSRYPMIVVVIFVLVGLTYLVWSIYCGAYGREAYLMQEMRASLSLSPSEAVEHIKEHSFIIRMFLETILLLPLNCSNMFDLFFPINGLMLSPVCSVLFFLIVFIFLGKTSATDSALLKLTTVFCIGIDVMFFGVLLWAFLFMFYSEFSPDNLMHMQNLASHYAGGAWAASLMMILRVTIDSKARERIISLGGTKSSIDISRKTFGYLVIVLLISLPMTFTMLFAEKFGIEGHEVNSQRRIAGEEQVSSLVGKIEEVEDPLNSRVLVADQALDGVGYCFVHYGLSPVSTVDVLGVQDVRSAIELAEQTHCNYVYFGSQYADQIETLRDELGDDFRLQELYKIG